MMNFTTISGIVTKLMVSTKYEDVFLNANEQRSIQVAAFASAAAGELLGAAMLGGGVDAFEMEIQYFSCKVSGQCVVGKLMNVGFAEGEFVEFVVEPLEGSLVAVAARNPERRIAWMPQYATRGHQAQLKSDIRGTLMWALITLISAIAFEYTVMGPHQNAPLWYFAGFYGTMVAITLVINIWMRRKVYSQSKLATEIFGAFGYVNPAMVDLNHVHRGLTHQFKRQPDGNFPPLLRLGAFRY